LPSVSHHRDCRFRDKQTFRCFPSSSSPLISVLNRECGVK
jgi:hypothetical protein